MSSTRSPVWQASLSLSLSLGSAGRTAAGLPVLVFGLEKLIPRVFLNRDGGPLDADNLRRRVFEKALDKAKLRHARVHDLRHTFASCVIQKRQQSGVHPRPEMGTRRLLSPSTRTDTLWLVATLLPWIASMRHPQASQLRPTRKPRYRDQAKVGAGDRT